MTGADITIRANMVAAPGFDAANGAIRIRASGATVSDNFIVAEEGNVSIRVAEPIRLSGRNRVAGFKRSVMSVSTEGKS